MLSFLLLKVEEFGTKEQQRKYERQERRTNRWSVKNKRQARGNRPQKRSHNMSSNETTAKQ
jgi:hypothetical protein